MTKRTLNKAWTVPVVEVDGELGFEFPDDVMDQLDLSAGDTILWEEQANGSWLLRKKQDE